MFTSLGSTCLSKSICAILCLPLHSQLSALEDLPWLGPPTGPSKPSIGAFLVIRHSGAGLTLSSLPFAFKKILCTGTATPAQGPVSPPGAGLSFLGDPEPSTLKLQPWLLVKTQRGFHSTPDPLGQGTGGLAKLPEGRRAGELLQGHPGHPNHQQAPLLAADKELRWPF